MNKWTIFEPWCLIDCASSDDFPVIFHTNLCTIFWDSHCHLLLLAFGSNLGTYSYLMHLMHCVSVEWGFVLNCTSNSCFLILSPTYTFTWPKRNVTFHQSEVWFTILAFIRQWWMVGTEHLTTKKMTCCEHRYRQYDDCWCCYPLVRGVGGRSSGCASLE